MGYGLVNAALDALDADLQVQILAAPILWRRLDNGTLRQATAKACGTLASHIIGMHHNTGTGKLRHHLRQELLGDARIHQQTLAGVTHARALGLGIHDDAARHLKAGALVDVDVAVAHAGLYNGDLGLAHACLDEAGSATRDEHVHQPHGLHERSGCRAIGRFDHVDTARR